MKPQKISAYSSFAAETMLKLLETADVMLEGVRQNKDPECIHHLRVACRRLMVAMEIFGDCFDKTQLRFWTRSFRKITHRLGVARDLDVRLALLDALQKSVPDRTYLAGIQRVRLRITQKRNRAQGDVVNALGKFSKDKALIDMVFHLRRLKFPEKMKSDKQKAVLKAQRRVCFVIRKHLEKIMAFRANMFAPDHDFEIHALRIAVRKTRYATEIFSACGPDGPTPAIRVLRKLQNMLGDLRDNTTLASYLAKFVEKESRRILDYHGDIAPLRPLIPGITFLLRNRQKHCLKQFSRLARYWRTLKSKNVWENMANTLRSAGKPQKAKNNPSARKPGVIQK
jgi:CHAD domain-containing protein